jgi:hypothetical protein
MSDTREALARKLGKARAGATWQLSAQALADEILAEFLVVPRSEVSIEYGVQYGSFVHGDVVSADAARRRAVKVFEQPADAARQRLVWAGPWSPLPENGDGQ